MTTLLKERKTWAMGIISRIPIKDFKSKLLGGKYRQKVEQDVPAIDVTPPTPTAQTFSFTCPSEGRSETVHETTTELKRCSSEPDLIGTTPRAVNKSTDASAININDNSRPGPNGLSQSLPIVCSDNFLQIPKRRRKHRKSKRRGSQLNHVDDFNSKLSKDKGLIDCKVIELPHEAGNSNYSGHEVVSRNGGSAMKKSTADINQNIRSKTSTQYGDLIPEKISLENKNEIQNAELISVKYKNSKMAVEKKEENIQTEGFEVTGRFPQETVSENLVTETSYDNQLQQENVIISVKSTTEEDSMNHEGQDEFEIESSISSSENLLDMDVELSCTQEKDKDTQISTWSLNLDSKTVVATFKRGHQRTQSDLNFLTETQKGNWDSGFDNGSGIVATRSLDLDAVASSEDITGREVERTQSETTLQTDLLKHDKKYYLERLNGIISKFSTWSLDMELLRKRSMEYLVVERAFSETSLGPEEHEKKRRCWSYHTLLYDVDCASRYQIYQPTVEDICEQAGAVSNMNNIEYQHATAVMRKQYIPSKSPMKELKRQCSEQIGNMYQNSKHIYNNRANYVAAFKERTRPSSTKDKVKDNTEIEKPVFRLRKAISLPRGNR